MTIVEITIRAAFEDGRVADPAALQAKVGRVVDTIVAMDAEVCDATMVTTRTVDGVADFSLADGGGTPAAVDAWQARARAELHAAAVV